MKKDELTVQELDAWRGFRRMGEVVSSRIAREIIRETGLSTADFSILMQLSQTKAGRQRQRDLQRFLEWDKTRLSHQLTRMVRRNLVERRGEVRGNTFICLTEEGHRLLSLARPVHREGIREHFLSHLSEEDVVALIRVAEKLRGVNCDETNVLSR